MAHRHPYSSIITEAMNHYILQSKERDTPTWQAYLLQLPTKKPSRRKKVFVQANPPFVISSVSA